jgi:comEA protein
MEQFYTPGEIRALLVFLSLGLAGFIYQLVNDDQSATHQADWSQRRITEDSLFFLLASKDLTLDSLHFYTPDTTEPPDRTKTPKREISPYMAPASVSLNSGTVEELQLLPSVGPATASQIVAYRAERGGFRTIEELMNVRGIGLKKFNRLKPYLRLN